MKRADSSEVGAIRTVDSRILIDRNVVAFDERRHDTSEFAGSERVVTSVASMTGFAAASAAAPQASLGVELKSVNSRFLELTIRLPDELRALCLTGFREVELRGLFGSARFDAVTVAERDRLDTVLRRDPLHLRRLVPRRARQYLYDAMLTRKLQERLSQALVPALSGSNHLSREELNDRIRQEVTLYGMRADVDEELQRLATHVIEVRRVLDAGGAVGRRLDFLMQELNREANTLGSKASAIEMTNAAVELKLLIEQMREQIQNLE